MAYIRTALSYESPIIFVQIEQDGKISKETFLSVYPGACGMYFQYKRNDYAITITNGRFNPPPEGWRGTVFYPLYDDYEDDTDYHEDDYDEYEDENEDEYEDDEYYHDEGYDKTNVGIRPQQKEDINQLYYDLLKNNDNDEGDNDDLYSDDE